MVHKRLEDSVGTKIRAIREEQGLSMDELAQRAGVSKQSIYKHERGITKNVPYSTILRFALALRVNPAYLVGWSESRELPLELVETTLPKLIE